MKYQIIQDPNETRIFAVNETTGIKYCFTPVEPENVTRLADNQAIVYDRVGELYRTETTDGADLNLEEVNEVWEYINQYWDRVSRSVKLDD